MWGWTVEKVVEKSAPICKPHVCGDGPAMASFTSARVA